MNTNQKNTQNAQNAGVSNSNEKPSYLMSVPVTINENSKGTGKFYWVWDKKDFSGKPSRMSEREDDDVKNIGEVVVDPESKIEVHLVRIKRNGQKRVWYSKSEIPLEKQEVASESAG